MNDSIDNWCFKWGGLSGIIFGILLGFELFGLGGSILGAIVGVIIGPMLFYAGALVFMWATIIIPVVIVIGGIIYLISSLWNVGK